MQNNYPVNMDSAYDDIENLIRDMREEDPEGFDNLLGRIHELATMPKRNMKLLLDLMAATPFEVVIPAHVRKNQPDIFKSEREIVSNVRFLGEYGGISVDLEPNELISDPRVVSITMVEMTPGSPLRRRVNEYRKNRLKKLRKHPF